MQALSFNTHLLLPQASRVAALLSRGFGSLFSLHSRGGQAIPYWGCECLWAAHPRVFNSFQADRMLMSWVAEEPARLDAAPRRFSSTDGREI